MFNFQIELVSPGFQTPRSLGLFCSAHFALVAAVDVAVGTFVQVRKKDRVIVVDIAIHSWSCSHTWPRLVSQRGGIFSVYMGKICLQGTGR